jgi:hypothetical protein
MSKVLFATSASRDQSSSAQRNIDQVSALYELGLLGRPDRSKRRERTVDGESLGGPFVQNSYPQKSKSNIPSLVSISALSNPPAVRNMGVDL